MTTKILNQCNMSVDKYRKAVDSIKWCDRSILLSEGLLVCAMIDLCNIDLFIESGVYDGKSAEIWGRYLLGSKASIIATDVYVRDGAKDRLSYLDNITLTQGDGESILPYTVNVNKDKRIGVFIDGPKGEVAVNLAIKLIANKNVEFVAVHDCHKMSFGQANYTRIAMEAYKGSRFFSDDEKFVKVYSYLDKMDQGKFDAGQGMRWYPGELKMDNEPTRILGSYGPTVGVFYNE